MTSERARIAARRSRLLLLAAMLSGVSPAAEDGVALLSAETAPGGDSAAFVFDGAFRHTVQHSKDSLQVLVELPGVKNEVAPGRLPEPAGALKGISIGGGRGGDDATRVIFSFSRPTRAVSTASDRDLEVRFEPYISVTGEPAAGAGVPAPIGAGERPVGTEDLLEISVFEVPELSRTVRVSEKGTISLPLLGEVGAAGLPPAQLERDLRRRLAERYVRDPQVSVFVREHGSKKVSVLGAVGKPGVYEMLGPRTLLQVLAQAGGLTEEVGSHLHVIRQRPGAEAEKTSIDVNDLLVNRTPSLNLPIQPGDIVSAPIDRPVYVYVDGAVKTPGRIEQLASRPLTLLQAISRAGGTTERANLKAAQILRQSADGTQTILEVNVRRIRRGKDPDPVLGEGDVVIVPETFF